MRTLWTSVGVLGAVVLLLVAMVVLLLVANDLRLKLRRWLYSRLTREQRRVIDQFRVRLNPHKLEKKRNVRMRLILDRELVQGVESHAAERKEELAAVVERVEDYANEIIPSFNVVSYYRLGYTVAAIVIRALYWPWRDRAQVERVRAFLDAAQSQKKTVVFVMNHRSNADFVLVAYVLARAIALSYAVGEWARVWPLEWLFKSFGSYFVRRGCKDPVYHLTLRRYLQIISDEGVTQGIFLEGGLSRDGALRPAKIGLIDSLATRPNKEPEVLFLPVGINYDRVLEDEVLTREEEGAQGMGQGWAYSFSALSRVTRYLFANLPRYFLHRVRKFGYAAVSFGEPVSLSELFDLPLEALGQLGRDERKAPIQAAADRLLARIGAQIPVTPVALVATCVLGGADSDSEDHHVSESELRDRLVRLMEELAQLGVMVVARDQGVEHIERVGLTILRTRGHVTRAGGVIVSSAKHRHLLRYYQHSIRPHLERLRALPEHQAADRLGLLGAMPEAEPARRRARIKGL